MKNTLCCSCSPVVSLIVVAFTIAVPILVGGLTLAALAISACGVVLARLAVIDMETLRLPNGYTGPLLWGGLLINSQQLLVGADQAIVGSVAGWAVLTLVRGAYRLYARCEGLGGGDVKLFAALGAWGGPLLLAPVMGIAALLGMVTYALVWASGRQPTRIPFGPALALAGWGWLLWALYCQKFAIG